MPEPGATAYGATSSGQGVYLYAVCRTTDVSDPAAMRGVADAPVRSLESGDLAALVSTVPLVEFGEDGLRRNLEDLGWVESVARAHNTVVAGCSRSGVVAPVSLATVFFDDEAVVGRLDQWRQQVSQALARVEGSTEVGVKAYHRGGSGEGGDDGDPDDSEGGTGSGTAYLNRLRTQAARREAATLALAETAHELHERLGAQTRASRLHPVQDPRLTGHDGQMILNAAYLVGTEDLEAFGEAVSGVAAAHPELEVEQTGPWPPYSFVTLGQP